MPNAIAVLTPRERLELRLRLIGSWPTATPWHRTPASDRITTAYFAARYMGIGHDAVEVAFAI